MLLINLAAIMERADENPLPSVYKEDSEAFNSGPSDLGYLTFIRNFVQGLASRLAGVLIINYDHPTVLTIGTMCWALSTAAVGLSKQFHQFGMWKAGNGFGLEIVIPAFQSFIADSYMDAILGYAWMALCLHFDGNFKFIHWTPCVPFVVDPTKTVSVNHDAGFDLKRDELVEKRNARVSSVWLETLTATKAVIKSSNFSDNCLAESCWFITMDCHAALLSVFAIGCAMGSFLGGLIADRLSQIYTHTGRIMCAQFSAFMGIPFSVFLLQVIPQSKNSYYTFAVTLFLMGLTISILSEKMFFYYSKSIDPINGPPHEALALSRGLLSMIAVPFGLCCLCYTPLYKLFRRDRANVRLAALKAQGMV
ncbi:BES1/BZR1-like protein 2-like [Hibiscus syriacus]|uniref:BES1/BZR1-like protein 2-like n=1 Tax=Hibiscus syriacus TaxID=106335 RepID=A0A6A3C5U5_HIBSY|nr:BES1/BZR1-like protein 2-like [Hibiscus syriacus]